MAIPMPPRYGSMLWGIEAWPITPDAETLATRLIELQALPPTEPEDALHVALATVSAEPTTS